MKWSRWQAPMGFFLAALIGSPAWGAVPPQPGTINYIEGQSSIGGQVLGENFGRDQSDCGPANRCQRKTAERRSSSRQASFSELATTAAWI